MKQEGEKERRKVRKTWNLRVIFPSYLRLSEICRNPPCIPSCFSLSLSQMQQNTCITTTQTLYSQKQKDKNHDTRTGFHKDTDQCLEIFKDPLHTILILPILSQVRFFLLSQSLAHSQSGVVVTVHSPPHLLDLSHHIWVEYVRSLS